MLVLAAAGCGGDDDGERAQSTTAQTETPPSKGARTETETAGGGQETGGGDDSGGTRTEQTGSPEDQPGGAGDEEPVRSQALFTGRAGRITPRVVRVPAFFSVEVVLRSADGQTYGLRIAGRTLRAGGALGSSSVTLDGLRPGRAYRGTELDTGVRVRIEATAEPGP